MSRVVCAGHVNWDVTLRVDRLPAPDGEAVICGQAESGGGSAANTAAVLVGLDCDPLLLGSVGEDRYAERTRRPKPRSQVRPLASALRAGHARHG